MNNHITILSIAQQAKLASRKLASLTTAEKNSALMAMAKSLRANKEKIKTANEKDLAAGKAKELSTALLDRLKLNDDRIESMAKGLEQVAALPDPIGTVLNKIVRPNGLEINKIRVPLGVIAMIYESRPNVTADVAGLCLKSGNAVILRGGSEALNSNIAILDVLNEGLKNSAIPEAAIQLITNTDHAAVKELVQLPKYIDLVIPRGGEKLINAVAAAATVPVIKHYKGVCHIYVDATADLDAAIKICENAKCQRPGVCNAMETLLVNKKVANEFLPKLAKQFEKYPVELRGDEATRKIVPSMQLATEADWEAEYLDLILAVKIVDDVDAAIDHINTYGSHHSDSILTHTESAKQKFLQEVDSAAVYVNSSTRFTDGGEFGMGSEIGISTDKLHARGPMGLEELTTYKYLIYGNGQVR